MRQFIHHEFAGWEATLIDNARHVLDKTDKKSDAYRAVQAVFAQSIENSALDCYGLSHPKAAAWARREARHARCSAMGRPRARSARGRR